MYISIGCRHVLQHTCMKREQRGSQGMGVVSNNWFDRAVLSIIHMFQPSC